MAWLVGRLTSVTSGVGDTMRVETWYSHCSTQMAQWGRSPAQRLSRIQLGFMLHHVSLPVADLDRAAAFYDAALASLGYRRVSAGPGFAGYGVEDGKDKLALMQATPSTPAGPGSHIALAAPSREAVDAFHEAALRHGASDNGVPGFRPHYGPTYYAAFVIDLDGHRIEAVHNA